MTGPALDPHPSQGEEAATMAAKCRRLADAVGDDEIREALVRLAEEYESGMGDRMKQNRGCGSRHTDRAR